MKMVRTVIKVHLTWPMDIVKSKPCVISLFQFISDVFNKSFDLGTFRFKSVKNGESCTNFLNMMISRFLT